MKLSIENLKTAITMLLAITVLTSSAACDELPKSPLPTVNRALLEMMPENDSILPLPVGLRLPSESKAQLWSMIGTFLPIVTGAVIWKLQKPTLVREYTPRGYMYHEYHQNPDRTLPIVLITSGVMIGPSMGYFYGGCGNRGITGIFIRTASVAAGVGLGCVVARSMASDRWMDFSGVVEGIIIGSIGVGIAVIHSAYDLGKVHGTVEEQNERRRKTALNLAPKLYGQNNAPGLQLSLTF